MFLHDEPGQIRFFETEFFPSGLGEILANFQTGSTSGSDTTRPVHTIDERKRRRMISNRESARRSRWRKKRHLENLNIQLHRLRAENREAKNRLLLALQRCQLVERENDQLRFEALSLLTRLSDSYQILIAMQQQQQQLH